MVVLSLWQHLFLQTFLDIGTGVSFISQREQPFYCWKNLYSDVIGLHILVELVKEADDFLRGYFLGFQEELEPLFEETGLYIIVDGFDVCQDFVADVLEDVLVVFWFIFYNELGEEGDFECNCFFLVGFSSGKDEEDLFVDSNSGVNIPFETLGDEAFPYKLFDHVVNLVLIFLCLLSLIDPGAILGIFLFKSLYFFIQKLDEDFEGSLSFHLFEFLIDIIGSFSDHAMLLKGCIFKPLNFLELCDEILKISYSLLWILAFELVYMFLDEGFKGLLNLFAFF